MEPESPVLFPVPWDVLDRFVRDVATPDDVQVIERYFECPSTSTSSSADGSDAQIRARAFRLWVAGQRSYPAGTSPDLAWQQIALATGILPSSGKGAPSE